VNKLEIRKEKPMTNAEKPTRTSEHKDPMFVEQWLGIRKDAGKKIDPATGKVGVAGDETPLAFLIGVMCDKEVDFEVRFRAAQGAAPYLHPKLAAMAKLFPNKRAKLPKDLRGQFEA
jgi:hypothetical protein